MVSTRKGPFHDLILYLLMHISMYKSKPNDIWTSILCVYSSASRVVHCNISSKPQPLPVFALFKQCYSVYIDYGRVHLSIYLSIDLSTYLFIYLSTYLSIYPILLLLLY